MDLKRVEYCSIPEGAPEGISITKFPDGGITMVVPRFRPKQPLAPKIIGAIVGLLLGCAPLFIIGWRGARAGLAIMISRGPAAWSALSAAPLRVLAVFSPILILIYREATRGMRNKPVVIGISPGSVFVDVPGWLRRKTFELRRERLGAIKVVTVSTGRGTTRFIRIDFTNRPSMRICRERPMNHLQFIAGKLNEAATATKGN